jgi:hypothetical protein
MQSCTHNRLRGGAPITAVGKPGECDTETIRQQHPLDALEETFFGVFIHTGIACMQLLLHEASRKLWPASRHRPQ